MLSEIRKTMLARRRSFAETGEYRSACEKICRRVAALPEFTAARNVMIYLPLKGEADITGLFSSGKAFYVPITNDAVITPARYFPDTETKIGEYGVKEPAKPVFADKRGIDFVLVPAVAADKYGNRVGFGKGCYDRFLADMSCARAAVCFEFQLTDGITAQPHDAAMDCIITEGGVYQCFREKKNI